MGRGDMDLKCILLRSYDPSLGNGISNLGIIPLPKLGDIKKTAWSQHKSAVEKRFKRFSRKCP